MGRRSRAVAIDAAARSTRRLKSLRTGFTLARHTNAGETLINALVAGLIVELQCRQIESLVELPSAPNLYWALTELPRPIIQLSPALHVESATPYYLFSSLKRRPDLETLTREQADRSLHGLITEFSDSFKFMGLEGQPTLEQKAWMNRATATAMVMANAGTARKEMLGRGWSEEKLDALSTSQMILIHTMRTYEELQDELVKGGAGCRIRGGGVDRAGVEGVGDGAGPRSPAAGVHAVAGDQSRVRSGGADAAAASTCCGASKP